MCFSGFEFLASFWSRHSFGSMTVEAMDNVESAERRRCVSDHQVLTADGVVSLVAA